MMKFRVPHQTSRPTIVELLGRAWSEASLEECYEAVRDGKVSVDDALLLDPDRPVHPDLIVDVAPLDSEEVFGVPEATDLARGDGFVVVDKAVGMPGAASEDPMSPVAFLADVLGLDRETFTPVWQLGTNFGGPWLCAADQAHAERLRERLGTGDLTTIWVAITPQFGLPTGELSYGGLRVRYAAIRLNGGLSELQLMPEFDESLDLATLPDLICELLAIEGAPVLGDRDHGGYMVPGGTRLRLMSLYDEHGLAEGWVPPSGWWPEEAVVARIEHAETPDKKPTAIRNFTVSYKTMEVVRSGHPWVLPDRDTSSTDDYEVGELVRLVAPDGSPGPFALVDGFDDVAARVWSDDPEAATQFNEEIALRVDEAFANRAERYRNMHQTDLFRLIHGEADGLPGLYVDRVGPLYRATIVGSCGWSLRGPVYLAIEAIEPQAMIIEAAHMSDVRQRGELPEATIVQHGAHYARPGDRIIAQEEGLKYWCEPWQGVDTGFFADQRTNRLRAAGMVAEGHGRWLNLFCHTGAYTVALVAAGAEVVSVDISKRYLDWINDNLELNALDASKNTNVAEDARVFLASDETTYDGIIVDPPTAARSDAGFWSVHKDYEKLLADCFRCLNPGGAMLVCRNARKRTPELETLVRSAAKRAKVNVSAVVPAPPASDYPVMRGFPEGDSFEGVWAAL